MMKLRAIQPETLQKRLKCLFYGNAGVGKTTAAISFPRVYLIDTERGAENAQYTELLSRNGGVIFQTNDFDEVMAEVMALMTVKHEYKTLVIDPLTNIYNDLLDKIALKVGTDFGKHYSEANKKMKHLCNLLLRLDMNVIITSHSKNEYGNNMTVLGQTFDCYKKLDYLFDLVFEIQKRGPEHIGITKKSRIAKLPLGESFCFSYDEISERYGRDVIERDAIAQELATDKQVRDIVSLIKKLGIADDIWLKWLEKADSESFEEMHRDKIQKCIDFLKARELKQSNGDN